jgi:hypothetical protein
VTKENKFFVFLAGTRVFRKDKAENTTSADGKRLRVTPKPWKVVLSSAWRRCRPDLLPAMPQMGSARLILGCAWLWLSTCDRFRV